MRIGLRHALVATGAVLAMALGPVVAAAPATAASSSGFRQCEANRTVGARGNFRAGSFQMRLTAINTSRSIAPHVGGTHTHYHRPFVSGGTWRVEGQTVQWGQGTCGP